MGQKTFLVIMLPGLSAAAPGAEDEPGVVM